MNNIRGILLIVLSMAAFAVEDMMIKYLSATVALGQILIFLGVLSTLVFWRISSRQGHSVFMRHAWRGVPLARMLTEIVSPMAFLTALSLIDLSTVAAVFQATPLVATMGAALFLKEQVGWRRWSAVCIGFLGVLCIIRPGQVGFEPATLLVLVAVFGIAARDLLTRVSDTSIPSTVLSFQGYLALSVAGLLLMFVQGTAFDAMTGTEWSLMLIATLIGMVAYLAIVVGLRLGDASVVTPFRYTRLVFSLILGMTVFGERPDAMTFLGAAVIIASGLYAFLRERSLMRAHPG